MSIASRRIVLPVPVRDFRVEVDFGVEHDGFHGSEIAPERHDALLPCIRVFRRRTGRPIAFRKRRRLVVGVAAELDDVLLGDAEMLEYLPKVQGDPSGFFETSAKDSLPIAVSTSTWAPRPSSRHASCSRKRRSRSVIDY